MKPRKIGGGASGLAKHADAIRKLGKRVVGDVIEIGARLTECKRICGHGRWLPWLRQEFGWEETTALRYMRLHELAQSKSGKLPDLPVSALYLLAAPSTPEAAKAEVIARAEAGEALRVAEVKRTIETSRKQPAKKRLSAKRDLIATAAPGDIVPILDDAETSAEARKAAYAADANPIIAAWDAANDAQRQEFVKLRGAEIGRAGEQADPFAVPDFLRRTAP
jgi:hypothetical protein